MRSLVLGIVLLSAISCQKSSTLIVDQSALRADEENFQFRRFETALATIEQLTDTTSAVTAAKNITSNKKAREAAFQLQALGRVYKDADDVFDEMADNFKELEDVIGKFAFQEEEGDEDGMVAERANVAKFLSKKVSAAGVEKSWLKASVAKAYLKLLSEYEWGSYEDDRALVIESLRKQLKKTYDRAWDLEILEEGSDGVHEFRRQLRWFNQEVQALGGLVNVKSTCPSPVYKKLLSTDLAAYKYSIIESTDEEPNPCLISKCLFLGMSEGIKEYADIKGQAEHDPEMHESNRISGPLLKRANKLKEKMDENELMKTLRQELGVCVE